MTEDELLRRLDEHMARGNEHMARGNEHMARGNVLMEEVREEMRLNRAAYEEGREVLAGLTGVLVNIDRHMGELTGKVRAQTKAIFKMMDRLDGPTSAGA